MNKKELIESIAGAADISKAAAEKALNGTLAAIAESLNKGDKVTLVGFGTFSVPSVKPVRGEIHRPERPLKFQQRKLLSSKLAANCLKLSTKAD